HTVLFFFSSRRRHTRSKRDWSSDVCSSDLKSAPRITDVVRGADLLDSTARQIYLQRLLGYPTPRYLHVPVAVNAVGEKLSKQSGAPAIGLTSARDQLRRALAFLGQPEAANLREAVRSWEPGLIPARRMVTAPDALE